MTNNQTQPAAAGSAAAELRARVDALYLEYVFPVLATLRIGEDPEALRFESALLETAAAVGVRVRRYIMPAELTAPEAGELIRGINADFLLSALLLIRPMPAGLDPERLEQSILPGKRISGPVPAGADVGLTLLSRVVDAAERKAR